MSEVMLNIIDADGAWHLRVHGSLLECVVAALGAEPETMEELESALSRFYQASCECGVFSHFTKGIVEEAWDAGLIIINLTARLALWDSTYSAFHHHGDVVCQGDTSIADFIIPYQVPDDWIIVKAPQDWRGLAERRRTERISATLDAREILYGQLADWLADQFLSRGEHETDAAIHARWLQTPRPDLQGAAPRDCLLARRHFIDMDLQWRALQWAHIEKCPPGLSPESHTYRYAGFGTHENVLYYELIRHLLTTCRNMASSQSNTDALAHHLRAAQHQWLHTGQPDFHGLSPFLILGYERARLPLTIPSQEVLGDDDCPICQEMIESSGPCFWHLDGCNMDDDFVFSFYATRQEWDEEQRRWQRFDRDFG